VFDFVDSQNVELDGEYDLVTNFPRRVYGDRQQTVAAAGLVPQGALFVQTK